MSKRKKKIRKSRGNIFSKVQRSAKVRSVKSKIRKKKAELKRLSGQYKRAVKTVAKQLSRKRR